MAKKKTNIVDNYMDYVEDFLKKKWGEIPTAWIISLEQLKNYLNIYEEAKKDIEKRGINVEDRFGSVVVNPNLKVMADSSVRIEKIVATFGLSPYANVKMNSQENKGTDNEMLDVLMMNED